MEGNLLGMKGQARKPHLATIAWASLAGLVVGIGLPVLVGSLTGGPSVDTGVIASPAHSFQITEPVQLSVAPNVVVDRGVLSIVDSMGKPATGEAALKLLKKGRAYLLLSGAYIRIGNPANTGGDRGSERVPAGGVEAAPPYVARDDVMARIDPILAAFGTKDIQGLRIASSRVTAILPDSTSLRVSGVDATFDLSRKNALTGTGSVMLKGMKVGFDLRLGPGSNNRDGKPETVAGQLKVKSDLFNATFDGHLDIEPGLEMRGSAHWQGDNLRKTMAWLIGVNASGAGFRKFDVAGDFDWSHQAMAFDKANVKLDDNEATGALAINFNGARPSMTGTLALNKLYLTRYLVGDEEDQKGSFDWASLYAMPFQMSLGQQIDVDVRMSASRVVIGGLETGPAAATIAIKNGRMLADIAQLELAGGFCAGQVGVAFRSVGPDFTFRGKLVNVDLSRIAPSAALGQMIQGSTGISVDLTASGASLSEVARSMTGTLGVRSETGGRIGVDFRGLIELARKAPLSGWSKVPTGSTAFDTITGEFVAQDGVLVAKRLEASSGKTLWSGSGLLNIASGDVDLTIYQGMAPPPPGGPANSPASVPSPTSETPGFEVRGPLESPTIRVLSSEPEPQGAGRRGQRRTEFRFPDLDLDFVTGRKG